MRFSLRFTRVVVFCLSSVMLVANVCAATSTVVPAPARAATMFRAPVEYVKTYAGDCVTPQTVFNFGDIVCAEAGGFEAALDERSRRFYWAAPGGLVAENSDIKADPDYQRIEIPSSGDFARVGTWQVSTINPDANREVRAQFVVRNPHRRFADIVVQKWGPPYIDPGDRVVYSVRVSNPGPDFAERIEITDEVPNEMTFLTVKQASGPEVFCKTPDEGKTGTTVCEGKGLESGDAVELLFYYVVNRDTSGRPFESSAEAFSLTDELNKRDNFGFYKSVIPVIEPDDVEVVEEEQ